MPLLNSKNLSFLIPLLKSLFGIPLTVVSFLFIFNLLLFQGQKITITYINYPSFALGICFIILFFGIKSVVWKRIIFSLGYKNNPLNCIYEYCVAELRRFIPGNIFSFITRIYLHKKSNAPVKSTLTGIAYEALLLVLSSLILSVPAVIFILSRVNILQEVIYAVVILSTGTLLLALLLKFLKIDKKITIVTTKKNEAVDNFFLVFLAWVLFGIGNYLIAISIFSVNPYIFIPMMSLFILSWLIGYLSVITPMGLGVREIVLWFGLSQIMPQSQAVVIPIILRLATIVAEVIFFFSVACARHICKKIKIRLNLDHGLLIVFFLSGFYVMYFTYITFAKYVNFFMGRFDLGNMDQTVWNSANGRILELSNPDGVNIISRLSIHTDILLALISPLYFIWSDPRMLLFAQTVVLSLGAIFIYKICQILLKNKFVSVVFAASYLLNPFVQRQNIYDFHAVTFATTFFIIAYYFFIIKKNGLFLLFVLLAMTTKENTLLVGAIFGLVLFFRKKKILGSFIFLSFLTAFYLIINFVIPSFRGSSHFALSYFQDIGGSPGGILKTVITNPYLFFSNLFTFSNLQYLVRLSLPTGFLSLLSPVYILFALPDLLIGLLSKNENFKSIIFHYGAVIIPFVYIASINSVKKIIYLHRSFPKLIGYYILFFSLLSTYLYGVLPGTAHPSLEVFDSPQKNNIEILNFLKTIPEDSRVASTNNLGAYLSQRKYLFTIPIGVNNADYVLFLLNDPFAQPSPEKQKEILNDLLRSKKYKLLYTVDNFYALRKN